MGIVTEYADKFIEDSKRGLYRVKDLFTRGELMLLPAIRKTFNSANILEVTVATTGYRGGDCGHGGRSVVRFTPGQVEDKAYFERLLDSYGIPRTRPLSSWKPLGSLNGSPEPKDR